MSSIYSATTEGAQTLIAATPETLIQLRGASTIKGKIRKWGVFFNGVTATAVPVAVRLLRQTTDGTSSGATEAAWDPDNPTANCTAFIGFSSTEPTAGEVLETAFVHPQAGFYVAEYPPDCRPTLDNAATSRIGIECNAPAGVDARAFVVWEE